MYIGTIIIAATTTLMMGITTPATAATKGAFDEMRVTHRATTGDYCITSGWGLATRHTRRLVRKGDCRTADDWQKRGLAFDAASVRRGPLIRLIDRTSDVADE